MHISQKDGFYHTKGVLFAPKLPYNVISWVCDCKISVKGLAAKLGSLETILK